MNNIKLDLNLIQNINNSLSTTNAVMLDKKTAKYSNQNISISPTVRVFIKKDNNTYYMFSYKEEDKDNSKYADNWTIVEIPKNILDKITTDKNYNFDSDKSYNETPISDLITVENRDDISTMIDILKSKKSITDNQYKDWLDNIDREVESGPQLFNLNERYNLRKIVNYFLK